MNNISKTLENKKSSLLQGTLVLALIGTFSLTISCSNDNQFKGNRRGWEAAAAQENPNKGSGAGDDDAIGSTPENTGAENALPENPFVPSSEGEFAGVGGCPINSQSIIILDFRSGWWSANGGGEFTQPVLALLQNPCQTVKIDYHHFVRQGGGPTPGPIIPPPDPATPAVTPPSSQTSEEIAVEQMDSYDQIWILSGSNNDNTDLSVNSSLFMKILDKLKTAHGSVLLAGGDGFITHANAGGTALGLGTLFASNQKPGFFIYHPGVIAASTLSKSGKLSTHPVFSDIDLIADSISKGGAGMGPGESHSDYLAANPKSSTIGKNDQDQDCIGTAQVGSRKVFLDAGWQRFYTITNDQEPSAKDTKLYLRNIIIYLSQ